MSTSHIVLEGKWTPLRWARSRSNHRTPPATSTFSRVGRRYDPEPAGNGNVVPSVSKLLFREGGNSNSGNAGGGFLVDGVSLASSASGFCTQTGFFRDGIDLTAAQIDGAVTGTLNATGCNIGAYNPTSVTGANIYGAN